MKRAGAMAFCILVAQLAARSSGDDGDPRIEKYDASAMAKVEQLARDCEAGTGRACNQLAEMAQKHRAVHVRKAAAEKVVDEAALVVIAKTDGWGPVREAAVRNARLRDQGALAQIAKGDASEYVRRSAVDKVTDRAVLAQIAQSDSEGGVRARAVHNPHLMDQALLATMALNDTNWETRKNAIEKLTDQEALVRIVRTETEPVVREAAIKNGHLTEQELIAEVAKSDPVQWIRVSAAAKLTDPAHLEQVAKTAFDPSVRQVAADSLGRNTEATGNLKAWSDPSETMKVTNEELLCEIAKTAGDSRVRAAALGRVATGCVKDGWTTPDATAKVTDQGELAEIAARAGNPDVARAAVRRLVDQTKLAAIARGTGPARYQALAQLPAAAAKGRLAQLATGVAESIEEELRALQRALGPNAVAGRLQVSERKGSLEVKNLNDGLVLDVCLASGDKRTEWKQLDPQRDVTLTPPQEQAMLGRPMMGQLDAPTGVRWELRIGRVTPTREFANYRAAQFFLAEKEVDAAKELLRRSSDRFPDASVLLDSLDPTGPRGTVSGRLVDAAGRGVSGARMSLRTYTETWQSAPGQRLWHAEAGFALLAADASLSAVTGRDGSFTIGNVPIGFWGLAVGDRALRADDRPLRVAVTRNALAATAGKLIAE